MKRTILTTESLLARCLCCLVISLFFPVFLSSCSRLPAISDLSGRDYSFYNQDSSVVSFPSAFHGKMVVMSFIYTHCPDVCPMTTNNIQHLQDTLITHHIGGVTFVTLTFDPNRDTPSVLKEYAGIRGISFDNWSFLWGTKANTDSVLDEVDFRYFPGDSARTKAGLQYFITHTNKVVLLDQDGRDRGEYNGSQLDFKQIVGDIKTLE